MAEINGDKKPHQGEGWGNEMSEMVEKLANRVNVIDDKVNVIDNKQSILSKEFEMFGGWFKESITSLKETTEKIEESNSLLRESLMAQKIENEYKFKELELKREMCMKEMEDRQIIAEQEKEIKKLSNSEKFKLWWNDPNSTTGKVILGASGLILLILASQFGVLDSVTKLLLK